MLTFSLPDLCGFQSELRVFFLQSSLSLPWANAIYRRFVAKILDFTSFSYMGIQHESLEGYIFLPSLSTGAQQRKDENTIQEESKRLLLLQRFARLL